MRKIRTMSAAVLGAGGLVLGLAGPASAHNSSNSIWALDSGGRPLYVVATGGVDQNHTRVWAEDRYPDNQPVRTWYTTSLGELNYVRDSNGSASGRGERVVSGVITSYQVCYRPLESEICTFWYSA